VCDEGDGVEHDEENVDRQAGAVLVDGPGDGAEIEGAVCLGAEGGEHSCVDIGTVGEAVEVPLWDAEAEGLFCVHGDGRSLLEEGLV
jgi:hypothetical protein